MTSRVHYRSDTAEWHTPAHLLDRVVQCLGGIDLDPASNSHAAPNVPAARHYTVADDGLARAWHGRVYLNPPYGTVIGAWVRKLIAEYDAGRVSEALALVPARTDTAWFAQLDRFPVLFLRGRLRFSGHANGAPFPSALVYLGPRLGAFSDTFADLGALRLPALVTGTVGTRKALPG